MVVHVLSYKNAIRSTLRYAMACNLYTDRLNSRFYSGTNSPPQEGVM